MSILGKYCMLIAKETFDLCQLETRGGKVQHFSREWSLSMELEKDSAANSSLQDVMGTVATSTGASFFRLTL